MKHPPWLQRGMALPAVLWLVVALSLILASVQQATKSEVRDLSARKQRIVGTAIAEAGIRRTIQEMLREGTTNVKARRTVRVQDLGYALDVEVSPMTGLIDINLAPARTLGLALAWIGDVPGAQAEALADQIVQARRPGGANAAADSDYVVSEELLQRTPIELSTYAKLARFLSADTGGNGLINPLGASYEVLLALAQGDAGLAARLRDQQTDSLDALTTGLPPDLIDAQPTNRIQLLARVHLDANTTVETFWRIVLTAETGRVPWKILEKSAARITLNHESPR